MVNGKNAERLLYLGIEGLKRLQKRGEFKQSERSKIASDNYVTELDTVRQWLRDFTDTVQYNSVDKLYNLYKFYVAECTNSKKISKEKFKDRVCEMCDCKLARPKDDNGNRMYIFVPKNLDTETRNKIQINKYTENTNK